MRKRRGFLFLGLGLLWRCLLTTPHIHPSGVPEKADYKTTHEICDVREVKEPLALSTPPPPTCRATIDVRRPTPRKKGSPMSREIAPARDSVSVTPADGTAGDLGFTSRAIRCEGAGVVTGIMASGTTRSCNFKAGETRALRFTRIVSTGTTATGIEAMH